MSETYAVCESCDKINRIHLGTKKEPICGACKSALPVHGNVIDTSDKSLQSLIAKSPLPVVVDVWAEWCGPCRTFAPTFKESSEQFAGKIVFAKLNSDENQRSSSQFGIQGIPTVLVFKNGKEVSRQSGAIPREQFNQWLSQFI